MSPSDPRKLQLELEQARPYLLRFALLQLRNSSAAEDAVQETLLAALERAARFAGQSPLKTCLVGILKHKIVDHLRRQAREPQAFETRTDDFDALFEEDGHWSEPPGEWDNPWGNPRGIPGVILRTASRKRSSSRCWRRVWRRCPRRRR